MPNFRKCIRLGDIYAATGMEISRSLYRAERSRDERIRRTFHTKTASRSLPSSYLPYFIDAAIENLARETNWTNRMAMLEVIATRLRHQPNASIELSNYARYELFQDALTSPVFNPSSRIGDMEIKLMMVGLRLLQIDKSPPPTALFDAVAKRLTGDLPNLTATTINDFMYMLSETVATQKGLISPAYIDFHLAALALPFRRMSRHAVNHIKNRNPQHVASYVDAEKNNLNSYNIHLANIRTHATNALRFIVAESEWEDPAYTNITELFAGRLPRLELAMQQTSREDSIKKHLYEMLTKIPRLMTRETKARKAARPDWQVKGQKLTIKKAGLT